MIARRDSSILRLRNPRFRRTDKIYRQINPAINKNELFLFSQLFTAVKLLVSVKIKKPVQFNPNQFYNLVNSINLFSLPAYNSIPQELTGQIFSLLLLISFFHHSHLQ